MLKLKSIWSRAYTLRPRDHIQLGTPPLMRRAFIPTYEQKIPPYTPISMLLGWEYGRQWLKDRDDYLAKRKAAEPKHFRNNYQEWIEKRRPNRMKPDFANCLEKRKFGLKKKVPVSNTSATKVNSNVTTKRG